jgi:hypothetical protein
MSDIDDALNPEPTQHTLTLLFERFLNEAEWRTVVDQVRLNVPHVKHLRADAVPPMTPRDPDDSCSCGHRRETHHVWGRCHGKRCKCTGFVLAEGAKRNPLTHELLDLITLMPDSQVDEILTYVAELRAARSAGKR